jgi:hypothetical protein
VRILQLNYIEDFVKQAAKDKQLVCGDTFLCERTIDSTDFVLCDGIGSGIYANIAAVTSANRLIQLFKSGISMRNICERVADSMHRARVEDIPFSTFLIVRIFHDGQFILYTFEAPAPIYYKDGIACPLKLHFYKTHCEVIGEAAGHLSQGDSLIFYSDGVSQAGMGLSNIFGLGEEELANFINQNLNHGVSLSDLPDRILKKTLQISGGRRVDDSTVAIMRCREATQLTLMSGPPSSKIKDAIFVEKFLSSPGTHVICGSTTSEICSRVLHRKVKLIEDNPSFANPPEYQMEGIDMVTEGAAMLNQLHNILGENPERFVENSAVERLCVLLQRSDIIRFLIGNAINDAHSALIFKQLGIRPREKIISLISDQLRKMGKLVLAEYY